MCCIVVAVFKSLICLFYFVTESSHLVVPSTHPQDPFLVVVRDLKKNAQVTFLILFVRPIQR